MKLIVAVGPKDIIGNERGTDMPWDHVSEDMKYFKEKTKGGTVVVGRKTADSIGSYFPLVDRHNVVLSRGDSGELEETYWDQAKASKEDASLSICNSWEDVRALTGDVWVAGGATVYNQALNHGLVNEAHVTRLSSEHITPDPSKKYKTFSFPVKKWVLHEKVVLSNRATVYVYTKA